jgi:HD-like signal output (HDOD) protein
MEAKTGIRSAKPGQTNGTNPILPALKHALCAAGDFPIRETVVKELREMSQKPGVTIEELTSMILAEPALGARIVHLVNSAYCNSSTEILTVSQAVVQVGMRNLVDLCAGLIRVQSLTQGKRKGDFFQKELAHSTMTSILARSIAENSNKKNLKDAEEAFIAGTLYCLGPLLLSFYFPQIYGAATQRAENRGYSVEKSLSELLGLDRARLNLAIAESLKIPDFYKAILIEAKPNQKLSASPLARILPQADQLASEILQSNSAKNIEESIFKISSNNQGLSEQQLRKAAIEAIKEYSRYLKLANLQNLPEPAHLKNFVSDAQSLVNQQQEDDSGQVVVTEEFREYVDEIKEAIESREPVSSIIASVMEAVAFGLGFDRVILMLINGPKTALIGRMSLGNTINFDPKSIARSLNDPEIEDAVDIKCFMSGNLTTEGQALISDSSCHMALPIGYKNGSLGVIYADKTGSIEAKPCRKMQACLSILVEILDEAVQSSN